MQPFLLMLALLQSPAPEKTVYIFSQRQGCEPCRQQERIALFGDGQLRVVYVYDPLPSNITATPTAWNPETKEYRQGVMSLGQLRQFAGLDQGVPQPAAAVRQWKWKQVYLGVNRSRQAVYQWQWVLE